MARLYGMRRSRASRNLWLAGEIGIVLDLVPVWQSYRLRDPQAPGAPLNTASPEFLAINPAGAVPVLDEDGFILTESQAINLHLARRDPGGIGPADAREDALMQAWALYGATALEEAALAVQLVHDRGRQDEADGKAEVAAAVARLARPLAMLDAHLAREGQIAGHRFTVADINMAEIIRYATAAPGVLAPFPAVAGWLAACQSRPAFGDMWALRAAEPERHPSA